MSAADLLRTAPQHQPVEADLVAAAIDAALACSLACSVCASACLSADEDLSACVRDALDCADVSATTARVLARLGPLDRAAMRSLLTACLDACRACAASCSPHAEHREHCARCAASCSACAAACGDLLDAVRDV